MQCAVELFVFCNGSVADRQSGHGHGPLSRGRTVVFDVSLVVLVVVPEPVFGVVPVVLVEVMELEMRIGVLVRVRILEPVFQLESVLVLVDLLFMDRVVLY